MFYSSTLSLCKRVGSSLACSQGVLNSKGGRSVGAVEMRPYYFIDSKRTQDSGNNMVIHRTAGLWDCLCGISDFFYQGLFPCHILESCV